MKKGFLSASDLRQTEVCSDCIERGDIHIAGYPLAGRRGRIRDCAGCNGTGRQRVQRVDIVAWYVSTTPRTS